MSIHQSYKFTFKGLDSIESKLNDFMTSNGYTLKQTESNGVLTYKNNTLESAGSVYFIVHLDEKIIHYVLAFHYSPENYKKLTPKFLDVLALRELGFKVLDSELKEAYKDYYVVTDELKKIGYEPDAVGQYIKPGSDDFCVAIRLYSKAQFADKVFLTSKKAIPTASSYVPFTREELKILDSLNCQLSERFEAVIGQDITDWFGEK